MEQLPIIDLNGLNAQTKPTILKQMEFALTQIGFMLVKAPEFDVDFQNECFKISHQFFDLPREIKDLYSNMNNPHFRGWGKGKKYDGKLIQNYGMGVDHETTKYDYTDNSIPLYKRMRDGPNQWPATKHVANFKPQMEELHKRYYKLSREISYLICEILNVDRNIYDNYFDPENPFFGTAINYYIPVSKIKDKKIQHEVAESYKDVPGGEGGGMGAHRDGAPFITLLCCDNDGLQVLNPNTSKWINVPYIPGTVIVNIGTTLMKLSKGKMISTTHRVNPNLFHVPRISLPYFLFPILEGDLVPFDEDQSRAGYNATEERQGRDRGLAYAVDRCNLFPDAANKFYAKDYEKALLEFKLEKERRMKEKIMINNGGNRKFKGNPRL